MASFFSPPVRLIGATTLAKPHPGNQLMRHYVPNRVGVNVYLMPGNVLTEIEPYSDLEAVRVFHGGHIHPVGDAEVALLVAAGYADNILEAGLPIVSPGTDTGSVDESGVVPPAGYSDLYSDSYGPSLASQGAVQVAPGFGGESVDPIFGFPATYQEMYT